VKNLNKVEEELAWVTKDTPGFLGGAGGAEADLHELENSPRGVPNEPLRLS